MCGLCGILHLDDAPVPADTLAAMNATLTHRGPDQGAEIISGPCGLGNRRLAVLDLSPSGALPMRNASGTLTLAYNGEIYNYPDLRRELERSGHQFRSRSDAEAVIALYEQRGLDFVHALRGMFALALWDAPRRRLVLARDRLGKKPLFYYRTAQQLLFASEIKALLAHPAVPRRPASDALPLLLAYGYVPSPRTFFADIVSLPPAHLLVCEDGRVTLTPYWEPPAAAPADPAARPEDYLDELRAELEEAVRLRLLSDVPLGAFLSGGLDSSLIVALMARHTPGQVKTFAIGFAGEPSFDETPYARQVATLLGTDHHEFIVEPDAIALLPKLVWHHDQPFADSSAIPTYLVSQHTRAHVTVALTGDGGDELFAGYERFRAVHLARAYQRLPHALRAGIRRLVDTLPEATSYRGVAQRARRFVHGAEREAHAAYFDWVRIFSDAHLDALLVEPVTEAPLHHFRGYFAAGDGRDLTAQLLDANLRSYLPDDLLVKADRCSMAASLEARSPFLDHRLVELAARIPSNLKLRGSTTKLILRHLAGDLLPADIINRPKHGFGVPVGRWFRADLHDYVQEILLDPHALARGYFREGALRLLIDEHLSGRRNHGHRLWLLLTFEWWHRLFIDPAEIRAP
ncbi:MAG: asparagine synthetase B [Anaerolineae bacterium]|nr:MAG: asparagine synthetase B [Anaerolineae bacterium]